MRILDRIVLVGVERVGRWVAAARARQYERVARVDPQATLTPRAKIYNLRTRDDIRIAARARVECELLTFRHGGHIEIGEDTIIGPGTRIWSASHVWIGAGVVVGHEVEIHDSNAHPLDASDRREHFQRITDGGHPANVDNIATEPVRLCDGVVVGFRSTILKGVTIGARTIVAPGSLVTTDLPPNSFAAGRPARVVSRQRQSGVDGGSTAP